MKVKVEFVTATSEDCPECFRAEEVLEKVRRRLGDRIDLVHTDILKARGEAVKDLARRYGIFITPMIALNDEILFSGRTPSVEELERAILELSKNHGETT